MSAKSESKMCDLCQITTNNEEDIYLFGDWMEHRGIRVHYYCLLLSTNLPQNGREFGGILGFLMRDIRNEIKLAKMRCCVYCKEECASIACFNCKQYFHLECGLNSKCLFQFFGEFRSYCDLCLPLDDTQSKLVNTPPSSDTLCSICHEAMGIYCPITWIYGKCCGKGYVHRICMQKYASVAGYYLKCIWCKDIQFREKVKEQGICVPDRDARWEQKGAFSELHRGHKRCDVETCLCPRGREYIGQKVVGKWNLINCTLCGSFGGHNPCILGNLKSTEKVEGFKCELCAKTEARLQQQNKTCSQESFCSYLSDMNNEARSKFQTKRKSTLENKSDTNEVISFSQDTVVSKSSNQKSCDEIQTDAMCKGMLIENLETVEKSPAKDNELDRSVFQIKVQSFQQNESHINEAHSFTEDKTVSNNSHQNLEAGVASVDMPAESLKCIHISCSTSIIKLTPIVVRKSQQNVDRHDTDVVATESQNIETDDMLNQNDKERDRSVFQIKRQSLEQNESHVNKVHSSTEDKTVSNNSHQNLEAGVASVDMPAESLEPIHISCSTEGQNIETDDMLNQNDKERDRSVFQIKRQSLEQNESHVNKVHSSTEDKTVSNNSHQNLEAGVASVDMPAESLEPIHISCSTESQNIETDDMLSQNEDQSAEGIGSVGHNSNEESDEMESISDVLTEEVDSYSTISEISYDSENEESISTCSLDSEEFNVSDMSIEFSQNEDTEANVFKQSSITSSSSHTTQNTENVACFDMYEFDDEMNCLGTCTVRIDFKDPRFTDKSIDEIQETKGLIQERDIIARNSDIGKFAQINKIINEYINKNV